MNDALKQAEGVMKYFILMDDRYKCYKKPKKLYYRLKSIVDYIHKLKEDKFKTFVRRSSNRNKDG